MRYFVSRFGLPGLRHAQFLEGSRGRCRWGPVGLPLGPDLDDATGLMRIPSRYTERFGRYDVGFLYLRHGESDLFVSPDSMALPGQWKVGDSDPTNPICGTECPNEGIFATRLMGGGRRSLSGKQTTSRSIDLCHGHSDVYRSTILVVCCEEEDSLRRGVRM